MSISYYTAEGLKKLKDELEHLKSVERPKASQAIAEARDKGDLSENGPEWRAQKHVIYVLFLISKRLSTETAFGFLSEER